MSENSRPVTSSISMSQMFAPLVGNNVEAEEIECGLLGVDLMPTAALLAGAGPTRLDPAFDLRAMVRMTPDLPARFVDTIETYVTGFDEGLIRFLLSQSHTMPPEIRDRIRWHGAHAGERRAAEALFAEAHLSGTSIQRAYLGGLLVRVDTFGHLTRWSIGCDLDILHAGLQNLLPQGVFDHTAAADLALEIGRPDAHEWPYRDICRVMGRHRLRIPLSPREQAETHHDWMTKSGHWDRRVNGEHDHLSDDWRALGDPPWPFAPDGRRKPEAVEEACGAACETSATVPATEPEDPSETSGADADPARAAASIERLRAAAAVGEARRKKKKLRETAEPDHKEAKEGGHSKPAAYILDPPRDREAGRLVEGISGRSLPLVLVPSTIAHARSELIARYPYAKRRVRRRTTAVSSTPSCRCSSSTPRWSISRPHSRRTRT